MYRVRRRSCVRSGSWRGSEHGSEHGTGATLTRQPGYHHAVHGGPKIPPEVASELAQPTMDDAPTEQLCNSVRSAHRGVRRSWRRWGTARITHWSVGTQPQPLEETPLQLIGPIYLELSAGQGTINREVAHPYPRHNSQRRSHFERRLLPGIKRPEVHASLVIHERPAPGAARMPRPELCP